MQKIIDLIIFFVMILSGNIFAKDDGVFNPNIIRFSVTATGKTGLGWLKRFEFKGIKIGEYAKKFLLSDDFQYTGKTYQVAVIKSRHFDNPSTIEDILEEGKSRNMVEANAEVACLIRDKFTDEEIRAMGLNYIITMHQKIGDCYDPRRFSTISKDGHLWLEAHDAEPDGSWLSQNVGLAFIVSE